MENFLLKNQIVLVYITTEVQVDFIFKISETTYLEVDMNSDSIQLALSQFMNYLE